ncbi:MAG: glycosyltransferase family 9 protein [archaeon]
MKLGFFLRKKTSQVHQLARRCSYLIEYLSWFVFSPYKFAKYPESVSKVLIFNEGALGDIFCSLRVIENLKRNNPHLNICFIISPQFYREMKFAEKLLNISIIPKEQVKNEKFDLTLFFTPFPSEMKRYWKNLGFKVGNEYTGIRTSLTYRGILFNRKIFPKKRHKLEEEVCICRKSRLKVDNNFYCPRKLKNKKVDSLLKKRKIKKFIVIHPSGKNFSNIFKSGKIPAYSWPLERFEKLVGYLTETYNYKIILTGTAEEKFIADKVIPPNQKKNVFNFSGKMNVEELVSLVSQSDLLISIDTSVAHIATFTGTKVIDLFGPSFPEIIGAYGFKEKQVNLFHPEKCVKCRRKGPCPESNNLCMKAITAEEVINYINKILKT